MSITRAGQVCALTSFILATADAEGMREKRLQKTTALPFTDSTPFCNEWLNRALKCISDYTT